MHILGLEDEYDRSEHLQNSFLSIAQRIELLLMHLQSPPPPDADRGIMGGDNTGRLLERHVCEAAGLPIAACVRARARGVSLSVASADRR
jgi:hypothetical protein